MPFTVSHAAAALPFRRSLLIPSALIVGTMAPDFQYFIHFSASGRSGHTLPGIFILTLPIALVVLWIFHRFVKKPVAKLLPPKIQSRLSGHLGTFRFFGPARLGLIVVSILVGIATHVLWDSFTHADSWLYSLWPVLQEPVSVPVLGTLPVYKVLQHGSTVAGLVALFVWLLLWYRSSNPTPVREPLLPSSRRITVIVVLLALAVFGGIFRATWEHGLPSGTSFRGFVVDFVITSMSLMWWQLVAYGVFLRLHGETASATQERA